MDAFNEWLQQFIVARGRGTGNKKRGKRYICVNDRKKDLYLDSPAFTEWIEEKKEAFAGLEHLKTIKN